MEVTLDLEDMIRIMRNLGTISKACEDLSEIIISIRKDVPEPNNRILDRKVSAMETFLFQIDQLRKVINSTLGTWS